MEMSHGTTFEARLGRLEIRAATDPMMVLAVGALVTGILLSIPPIIRAARERPARHPDTLTDDRDDART
jgi:hypothetical protein